MREYTIKNICASLHAHSTLYFLSHTELLFHSLCRRYGLPCWEPVLGTRSIIACMQCFARFVDAVTASCRVLRSRVVSLGGLACALFPPISLSIHRAQQHAALIRRLSFGQIHVNALSSLPLSVFSKCSRTDTLVSLALLLTHSLLSFALSRCAYYSFECTELSSK